MCSRKKNTFILLKIYRVLSQVEKSSRIKLVQYCYVYLYIYFYIIMTCSIRKCHFEINWTRIIAFVNRFFFFLILFFASRLSTIVEFLGQQRHFLFFFHDEKWICRNFVLFYLLCIDFSKCWPNFIVLYKCI